MPLLHIAIGGPEPMDALTSQLGASVIVTVKGERSCDLPPALNALVLLVHQWPTPPPRVQPVRIR